MQPERLAGRESGRQRGVRGFFRPPAPVDTLRLKKAECELRLAAQSLWTYRQKDQPHSEVANLLESAQDALSSLINHVRSCRQLLDEKELD